MKPQYFIIVLLVAIAIGFTSHAVRHSEGSVRERGESALLVSKSRSGVSLARRSAEIKSLTKGVSLKGGREEWFRWLASLENASLTDLPQFISLVGNNTTALNLIAERWVELDPEHCFRYLLTRRGEGDFRYQDSADSVFSELFFKKWIQRDLEAVVVALDRLEALADLDELRGLLVRDILKTDPLRGLTLGSRWKTFHRYDVMPPLFREWVKKNPRVAVEAIFEIPSSHFLAPFAELWAATDPRAALDFAFEKGGDRGFQFAESVFTKWSQDDFSVASQKLSELPDQQASFLTPILVETWSKSDPVAALDWSTQSLTGKLRNDSIERVVLASAFSKLASPRDLLARIESPQAYHQAVVGLSHKLWGKSYSNDDKKLAEAITWFDDVEESRTLDKIFSEFTSFLASYDFERLDEFMRSPRAHTVSELSFGNGISQYAWYGAPAEAMAIIAEVPSSLIPEASKRVFSQWYEKEPEAAAAWVGDLAVDDPRRPYLVEGMDGILFDAHEEVVVELNSMPPVIKELMRERITEKQKARKVYNLRRGGIADWEKLLKDTALEE